MIDVKMQNGALDASNPPRFAKTKHIRDNILGNPPHMLRQ